MPDSETYANGRREAGASGRDGHRPKGPADLQGKRATGRTGGGEGGGNFPDNGPNGRRCTPEQEERVRRLVKEGMAEKWARRTVLAGDHPLGCDCEVCL
jgi:hypothetical protein